MPRTDGRVRPDDRLLHPAQPERLDGQLLVLDLPYRALDERDLQLARAPDGDAGA
jgi:hypothetical protein